MKAEFLIDLIVNELDAEHYTLNQILKKKRSNAMFHLDVGNVTISVK